MSADENLKNLNITLPKANDPVGSYAAIRISGNLLFISGQISIDANGNITKGKLGKDLSINQGQDAAKLCAINIIGQAKKACNEKLENIKNCIKLTGYVNSTNEFIDQPKVINGCSDLLVEYFGNEKGVHARSALGVYVLPNNIPVEIEMIVEISDWLVRLRLSFCNEI